MNTEMLEKQTDVERRHELLRQMANEQGVKPIEDFDDIPDDLWPEDQSVDDFLAFINELRKSDNPRRTV
jgi:hypothetical protein